MEQKINFTAADARRQHFSCVPAGQKVYFYANEYLTNGGELTTIPDTANPQGRKEFSIKDHIGSVRCVVGIKDSLLNVRSFDYKPFGDSLGSMQERLGFMDNEFDTESRYFPMGARMYDAKIGRFLSVDPLFEKFRTQGPYNYAFNSPLTKSDPSGLAPKGEKNKGNKLLAEWEVYSYETIMNIMQNKVNEAHYQMFCREMEELSNFQMNAGRLFNSQIVGYYTTQSWLQGGGVRINGTPDEREKLASTLSIITGSTITMDGNGNITGISRRDNNPKFDESFARFGGILSSSVKIDLEFADNKDLAVHGKNFVNSGGFFPYGFNGSTIPSVVLSREAWFQNNVSEEDLPRYLSEGFLGIFATKATETFERVLAHEFLGHAYLFSQNPHNYLYILGSDWKEQDAVHIENIVGEIFGTKWRDCYDCTYGTDPKFKHP